jgi:hypothetical protein
VVRGRSRRASAGLLEDRRRGASGGGAGWEIELAPDSVCENGDGGGQLTIRSHL